MTTKSEAARNLEEDDIPLKKRRAIQQQLVEWAHETDAKVDRDRPSPRNALKYLRKIAEGMNGSEESHKLARLGAVVLRLLEPPKPVKQHKDAMLKKWQLGLLKKLAKDRQKERVKGGEDDRSMETAIADVIDEPGEGDAPTLRSLWKLPLHCEDGLARELRRLK